MSKGRFEKTSAKRFPWILVVAAVALLILLLIVMLKSCDGVSVPSYENEIDSTTAAVEKNNDSIAIPGYEGLSLNANSKKQALCLPNPAQNTCYFKISLLLEDGTLLWQSELIEPGATSEPIVLQTELEEGTYPRAILHYSCFEMNKDLTPLNGAEIKVTLRVK